MVNVTFHLAIGMSAGMAAAARPLFRAWRAGQPVARPLGRWLLVAAAGGLVAVVPNLLRHAGCPDRVCDGWWMNLFVCHPAIRRIGFGGAPLGAVALAWVFAAQYALVLAAIIRCGRRAPRAPGRRPAPAATATVSRECDPFGK
jgi:hypothetical protein